MLIIEGNALTHVDSVVDIIEHYGEKDLLEDKKSRDKVVLPRQIHNDRNDIKSTKKEKHNNRRANERNGYVDSKIKSKKVKSRMFEKHALSAIRNRSRVYHKTI